MQTNKSSNLHIYIPEGDTRKWIKCIPEYRYQLHYLWFTGSLPEVHLFVVSSIKVTFTEEYVNID